MRRQTGIFGLGVADGVYMWRNQNIDAGALARKLTSTCQGVIDGGAVDVLTGECYLPQLMRYTILPFQPIAPSILHRLLDHINETAHNHAVSCLCFLVGEIAGHLQMCC